MVVASIFSQLQSFYNALPVLHKLVFEIKSIPHGSDAPHVYFHWLTSADPLFVVVGALAVYLAVSFFRHHWRLLIVLVIFISFGSLLTGKLTGYPAGGGAILDAANKLPLKDRPVCVIEALGNGANWMPDLLPKVKICRAPKKKVVIVKTLNLDNGRDGYLEGKIDGPSYAASVRAPAPTAVWTAATKLDELGNRAVYLQHGPLVYEIRACPSDGGQTPAKDVADTTGISFTNYLYKYADPSAYSTLVKNAASLRQTHKPGIYLILDASGEEIGYLLPASGEHGQCAVISGPYLANGSRLAQVAKPSQSQIGLLDLFGARTLVTNLRATTR